MNSSLTRYPFLTAFVLILGLLKPCLSAQTISRDEMASMTPGELSAWLQAEFARSAEEDSEWNRLNEADRDRRREIFRLSQEETAEREKLMQAFTRLPPEEQERRHPAFQQDLAALRSSYREARNRLETPSPPPEASSLPDRPIDRWQFLAIAVFRDQTEFSLSNPWEQQSFWGEIGDQKFGIELVEWKPEENSLVIRTEENHRELTLGNAEPAVSRNSNQAEEAVLQKWQLALKVSPKLLDLERQFQEMVRAKQLWDQADRRNTVPPPPGEIERKSQATARANELPPAHLAAGNLYRAIGLAERLLPHAKDPIVADRILEVIFVGHMRLDLTAEADLRAREWIQDQPRFPSSALGWRILADLALQEERLEDAQWIALQPIALADPGTIRHLEHCYALAIHAYWLLEQTERATALFNEMHQRNLPWPDDSRFRKTKTALTTHLEIAGEAEENGIEEADLDLRAPEKELNLPIDEVRKTLISTSPESP